MSSPHILKGLPVLSAADILKNASQEQLKALQQHSFALWAQSSGIEVDGRKFSFDDHRYLLSIYQSNAKEIIWMKAAQLGATIYMLLRLLWFCRTHTIKAGLYFPTEAGSKFLSKDRLSSIISSNEELQNNMLNSGDTLSLKQIKNIHGNMSSLYMLYLGGKASKDSVPLDIVGFDEVRLSEANDVDQALERISHSQYKYRMYLSTAGMPNQDVHKRFLTGTQHTWHIKCQCLDGFIPSEVFPNCIIDTGKEVYLRCPRCKYRIQDKQNGAYLPLNPGAEAQSFHVSQLCSNYISTKEIWEVYKNTTNMKEFFNAKLGRPYIDIDNQPINEDALEACVNNDLLWGFEMSQKEKQSGINTMGVDQHSGNNYAVIMRRGPDSKNYIIHYEIIERDNPYYWENGQSVTPFRRLYDLMREYNISTCMIDAMPNANEAQDFARYFNAKVFLAWYGEAGQDQIKWLDKARPKEQIRKAGKEVKLKYQAILNKYQSLDYTLRQFSLGNIQMPSPDKLIQVVRNEKSGRFEAENIVRTRMWVHLKSMVRVQKSLDKDGEHTGRFKMVYEYAGSDPHTTHAQNYNMHAMTRARRTPIFSI